MTSTVLGFVILAIVAWEDKRSLRRSLEDVSIALGVTVEDLDKEELAPRITQLLSERYSSELLRNRLSDLCGALQTAWNWLSLLLQGVVLLGVIWYTVTGSLETAVYAWLVTPLFLFFWVSGVAFALICKLLTGRYPGQAKQVRKSLAESIRIRREDGAIVWKVEPGGN